MPFAIGQLLNNRYRIAKLIGQGGFGAVYRAWDTSLNIAVAVKENLDTSPEAGKQFGYEARILAPLNHPHLPRVTDYFFISGQGQYLVMDFVEGEDLQAMLDRLGPLPESQVLTWIEQVCDALSYLHSQNPPIIHRDLKPANIKIRSDGRAMLVDFGIAKVYDPHLATTIGAKAVTPGFSPPEQYGQGKTDARSDIYALGATLYTLLTGQQPPESVQLVVGSATLPPPCQIKPQVTSRAEQIILTAMQIDTRRRFQSAADLRAALTSSAPISVPPRPPAPPAIFSHPLWPTIAGGVGLITVIAACAWGLAGMMVHPALTQTPTVTSQVTTIAEATQPSSPTSESPTATPTPLPLPTGERIAFYSNRDGNTEIYVMNTDGSDPINLTNNPASDADPAWSPDGTRLAFYSSRDGNDEIYVMNANGSEQINLTKNSASDSHPAWSPDGTRLAFSSNRDGNAEIYVMNADGSHPINLTKNLASDSRPAWSPDGTRLAFSSNRDGNAEIYVMNADGSHPINLTKNSTNDMWPTWSPDGIHIAFSSNPGNTKIYIMDTYGSKQINLTNNPTSDSHPAWSPDGQRIVFFSRRDGDAEIYVMNADGSEQRNLTNNPANDFAPAWSPQ